MVASRFWGFHHVVFFNCQVREPMLELWWQLWINNQYLTQMTFLDRDAWEAFKVGPDLPSKAAKGL
jgi:hypothetical protein